MVSGIADGRRRRHGVRPARARLRGARLRGRIFPPARAALSALAAGGAGRGAALAVRGLVLLVRVVGGAPLPRWTYVVGPLAGALLWPLVTVLLQWPQRPQRSRRSAEATSDAPSVHPTRAVRRALCAAELEIPSASCFLFRRRLMIAGVLMLVGFGGLSRPLRLSAGHPARALPDARREQPHRHRADRAQSRRHHRPQRRRARAELFGLHARDHPVAREESRRDDRRASPDRRGPAARPQALQAPARGDQELREPAAAHAPVRRGSRALRGQPLPLSRRRDQGAAVPPVSLRRARLACDRLYRPHQRRRRRAHRRLGRDRQLQGLRLHRQGRHRALLRARAARHHRLSRRSRSTPAAAPCARCRARRRSRATT